MRSRSVKHLKISILLLTLLALLTWGILAALVFSNHLPGYITTKELGSLIAMVLIS